jgi:phospholipid/cholesterol/gamma-HCH transport system substrate-binding protein
MVLAVGGQAGFFWQRYSLKARFDAVQGLKAGAVVRLSGKEVGRVTSVEFSGRHVEVVMELSRDVRALVTSESTATVGTLSLLGEPIIDLTASDCGTPLEPWAFVRSVAGGGAFDRLSATASASLSQMGDLLGDVRSGTGTVGKLLTDDALYRDLQQFIETANVVVKQVRAGEGTLGKMTTDASAYDALKSSLENLQAMTDRLNRGEGSLGQLLHDPGLSRSLTSAAANVDAITARLQRGDGTAGRLLTDAELYTRLNDLTGRVNALVTGLEEGRGSAGRLLRDQQLYDNLNTAASELRGLLTDVRKDPKKYLNVKVSIF